MDKNKLRLLGIIVVCATVLTGLGYLTADSWLGLVGAMFGAR
jgi:hypothetical protein